jgi:hypothetical protein
MTVDYTKATKWMKRERRLLTEFLARAARESREDHERADIESYVAGTNHVGYASTGLDMLESVHGARGCLEVLDGNADGFNWLDLACLEDYWVIRLLVRGYELDERPGKHARVLMDRVATCWMHAAAIGADDVRRWLDDLIRKVDDGDPSVNGKSMNALCTLAAHFATGKDCTTLERSGWASVGPYSAVCHGTLQSGDYDDLAAFHEKNVDGPDFPPFHAYPYRLAPLELLAIERRTGIAMSGRHPLVTSPLAQRRTVPVIPMSDTLQSIASSGRPEVT